MMALTAFLLRFGKSGGNNCIGRGAATFPLKAVGKCGNPELSE
jgi:hypothetical protein